MLTSPVVVIAIFVVLAAVLFAISFWAYKDVSGFLNQHPAIESAADLDAFKGLARRNMKMAIVYIGLGILFVLVCIQLVRTLDLVGLLIVLAFTGPNMVFSNKVKGVETRSRSLPCGDERMAEEYQRIGVSWQKKLLPDF